MIEIRVRPKGYTQSELAILFKRKYSDKDEDFEEWLSAMEITGQLSLKRGRFYPTIVSEEMQPRQRQIELLPETEKTDDMKRKGISVFHWTKVKKTGQSRIAIRAGEDWVKSEGIPATIILQKVYKDGKWIDILEKPQMIPRTPREYTIEKYLTEIPLPIVRKYGLTGKEPVQIRLVKVVKAYFSSLRLWGYNVQAMLSFGHTAAHTRGGERQLELHGYDFYYETMGNITDEMERWGSKILNIAQSWLNFYDPEYYVFIKYGTDEIETIPPQPIEGIGPTPLRVALRRQSKIRFSDMKKGRTIANASGSMPKEWYEQNPDEMAALFTIDTDSVGEAHGYKGRGTTYRQLKHKQITLDEVLKKGKTGEGFKRRKR